MSEWQEKKKSAQHPKALQTKQPLTQTAKIPITFEQA